MLNACEEDKQKLGWKGKKKILWKMWCTVMQNPSSALRVVFFNAHSLTKLVLVDLSHTSYWLAQQSTLLLKCLQSSLFLSWCQVAKFGCIPEDQIPAHSISLPLFLPPFSYANSSHSFSYSTGLMLVLTGIWPLFLAMKTLISFHFSEMIALSSVGIPAPTPQIFFWIIDNKTIKSKNYLSIVCKA